jgi:hypothetical protein
MRIALIADLHLHNPQAHKRQIVPQTLGRLDHAWLWSVHGASDV